MELNFKAFYMREIFKEAYSNVSKELEIFIENIKIE